MNRFTLTPCCLLFGLLLPVPLSGVAQYVSDSVSTAAATTSTVVGQEYRAAAFSHDGCVVFHQWVVRHLTFPQGQYFDGQELFAYVSFEVTKGGTVRNIKVISPASPHFGERLAALLDTSPPWSAAVRGGKAELSRHTLCLSLKVRVKDKGILYAEDMFVYDTAEQMPRFNGGGGKAFANWFTARVGDTLPDGRPIKAEVKLNMIVEKDGSISKVESNKIASLWLQKRISGLLAEVPHFTPAIHFGDTVRVRIGVKLSFGSAVRPVAADATAALAPTSDELDRPYLIADVMPKFQGGGLEAFRRWVMSNLKYPSKAVQSGIEGRVVVSFVVECDGTLSNTNVLQSPSYLLTNAALEVLADSPRWSPGMQKGRIVRVRYLLPLEFRLSGSPANRWPSSAL